MEISTTVTSNPFSTSSNTYSQFLLIKKIAATDMMGIILQLVQSDESVLPDVLIIILVSECCGRHTFLKMSLKHNKTLVWAARIQRDVVNHMYVQMCVSEKMLILLTLDLHSSAAFTLITVLLHQ